MWSDVATVGAGCCWSCRCPIAPGEGARINRSFYKSLGVGARTVTVHAGKVCEDFQTDQLASNNLLHDVAEHSPWTRAIYGGPDDDICPTCGGRTAATRLVYYGPVGAQVFRSCRRGHGWAAGEGLGG